MPVLALLWNPRFPSRPDHELPRQDELTPLPTPGGGFRPLHRSLGSYPPEQGWREPVCLGDSRGYPQPLAASLPHPQRRRRSWSSKWAEMLRWRAYMLCRGWRSQALLSSTAQCPLQNHEWSARKISMTSTERVPRRISKGVAGQDACRM